MVSKSGKRLTNEQVVEMVRSNLEKKNGEMAGLKKRNAELEEELSSVRAELEQMAGVVQNHDQLIDAIAEVLGSTP